MATNLRSRRLKRERKGKLKRGLSSVWMGLVDGVGVIYSEERREREEEEKKGVKHPPGVVHGRPVHMVVGFMIFLDTENVSYLGLYNLAALILFLANIRLVLVNIYKYGWLLSPMSVLFWLEDPYSWPGFTTFASMFTYILIAFLLQRSLVDGLVGGTTCWILSLLNVSASILVPGVMCWVWIDSPIVALAVMLLATCLLMKLFSYVMVNMEEWGRHQNKGKEEEEENLAAGVCYPDNVTMPDICYFMVAPTLCYELNFPRSVRIKKRRLTRYAMQGLFLLGMIWVLAEQYMAPLIKNALGPFKTGNLWLIAERLLKLALPNLYVWLLGFYLIFEVLLGVLAELLRFGDRQFYTDWWNARSLNYFWRTWNLPVHRFLLRHIYTPLRKRGYSTRKLVFFVFFVSALFHEVVVSVAFHTVGWWAFGGMMVQPFLVLMARPIDNANWGNVFFWVTIALGQPFAILMYAVDWFARNPLEGWNFEPWLIS